MIGADQFLSATAGAIDQAATPVAANIGEGAQYLVCSAHDNDAFADIIEAVPIAHIGNIADMAHHLPRWTEDAVHLKRGEFGIIICPRRQAPTFQMIMRCI